MKSTIYINLLVYLLIITSGIAQVGINTTSPANGALLDVHSSNKGLLIPRVALSSTNDTSTITPSATVGLLVYNTVTAGALPIQVTPGFYYWNGTQWLRFYNRGYNVKYDQTSPVTASIFNWIYTSIPGLDTGYISVPYSGTYQIKVETSYAAGNLYSTSYEGVGQASVRLTMGTNYGLSTGVKETYVTSTSKRIGSTTINGLPQNTTIIYTVDLNVLNTYRFAVQGREWSRDNVSAGQFGKNTSGYSGASGITDAQRGSLTITLIKQQ
ncbi:hypothetical protein [Ulvibacter litoralis]|uniref:Uncharacterized protein n=1 Tax=Ulvibacter litoralis TaxID=227084 RepID=A0A1G7FWE9_9FLAO|nr:hypothetical protein [Ulvibacter litoralis]GHC65720.1 hypothetical protein GCM10008083_33610 [Ulvibacter litoralis]SDE80177.1 hypothetical protein SAMN05421855_102821 [Ulvibacter litoralis]